MVVLQQGKPNRHILYSKGADVDLNRFYCTTSATAFGRQWSKFEPRTTRHQGTGYLSNFRPGVYYSAKLDDIDNPLMGEMMKANYLSVTHKHYRANKGPDGYGVLPNTLTKQGNTGFIRQPPLTIPTQREVNDVSATSRVVSAPAGILPRDIPHLYKVKNSDPLANENGGFGPARMTTETSMQYKNKCPAEGSTLEDCRRLGRLSIGQLEEGGFVHNIYKNEPLTYHPSMAHKGDGPSWLTNRPTGVPITATDFVPSINALGNEIIPKITENAQRDNGFTMSQKNKPEFSRQPITQARLAFDTLSSLPEARRGILRRNDPCEYINAVHGAGQPSVNSGIYLGQQRPSKTEADLTGTSDNGFKESSGYANNTIPYNLISDTRCRFVTDNNMNYQDHTPVGIERGGHTYGGVLKPRDNGFRRGTKLDANTLGSPLFNDISVAASSVQIVRDLHPYVAKSLVGRDSYFVDRTQNAKMRPVAA